MRRLGAIGFVVWLAMTGGAGAQKPARAKLLSVDTVSARYERGVARIRGGWVLSGPAVIARTDNLYHEQTVNRAPIPERLLRLGYRSLGDIDVVDRYVYAPLERDTTGPSHQVTARWDLATLKFVDSVELPQHASPFVAIEPLRMIAYTMDRSDGKALLRYDVVRNWKPLPPLVLDRPLVHVQGGAVASGALWISTSDRTQGIYQVDEKTGHVDRIGSAGHDMVEGIAARSFHDADIHVMTVDRRRHRVRLRHFKVVA